jgi:hypothetical protein
MSNLLFAVGRDRRKEAPPSAQNPCRNRRLLRRNRARSKPNDLRTDVTILQTKTRRRGALAPRVPVARGCLPRALHHRSRADPARRAAAGAGVLKERSRYANKASASSSDPTTPGAAPSEHSRPPGTPDPQNHADSAWGKGRGCAWQESNLRKVPASRKRGAFAALKRLATESPSCDDGKRYAHRESPTAPEGSPGE